MSPLLMVGLALLLGLWTSGLARSKGRSGIWIWGVVALLLTLLPLLLPVSENFRLLGMGPLFVLLFLRRPQPRVAAPPKGLSCPRCNEPQQPSQRYCVSCGWELGRAYPETQTAERVQEAAPPTAEEPAVATASVVAEPETPAAAIPETQPDPGAAVEPSPAAAVAASQDVQPAEAPSHEVETPDESAPEIPVFRGRPTPANLTERGVQLFNLGRIQESIDQFTKAIALDPDYKEAWEYRAEAYAKQGRGEQAAADRRRLQALDTG